MTSEIREFNQFEILEDCFGQTICVPHRYNGCLVHEGEDPVNYAATAVAVKIL